MSHELKDSEKNPLREGSFYLLNKAPAYVYSSGKGWRMEWLFDSEVKRKTIGIKTASLLIPMNPQNYTKHLNCSKVEADFIRQKSKLEEEATKLFDEIAFIQ